MNSDNILHSLLNDLVGYGIININIVASYYSFLVDKFLTTGNSNPDSIIEFDLPKEDCLGRYLIPVGRDYKYNSYSDIFGEGINCIEDLIISAYFDYNNRIRDYELSEEWKRVFESHCQF